MKKRILFVDDDRNLIQGLERMLRCKRNDWDMTFMDNGREALDILSNDVFDAIVADYKMPVMDGLELLELVKERYPEMVRILLTGQSEPEIFERSKEIVHKYLSKPCESDRLKSIIEEVAL